MTTTYILAGSDINNAFKDEMVVWKKYALSHADLVILHPQNNETFEETLSQIKGPANIILAAHGNESGGFRWTKKEKPSYEDLFAALPRTGIESVTIEGCYGELAQNDKNALQNGTLLQSVVGAKVEAWGGNVSKSMVTEILAGDITPLHIMLTALNNTDPGEYKILQDKADRMVQTNPIAARKQGLTIANLDPNDVLPHLISIGGKPPIPVNLNDEMANISNAAKAGQLDGDAFQAALVTVKEHFTTSTDHIAIDTISQKLQAGADTTIFTPNEKRIAYAITLADMYANGTIARDIEKSMQATPVLWDGQGSETVAKIQAVLSHAMPANGNDAVNHEKVSGLITPEMLTALAKVQPVQDISTPKSQQVMLDELLHEQSVKDIFGTIQDAHGDQIANIQLQRSDMLSNKR